MENQLNNLRTEFYSDKSKPILFGKSQQKFDCAEMICSRISIESLLYKTGWNIENTHHIYFNYQVFKMYAHPENFQTIVDYILVLCSNTIQKYGKFELHVDLSGFTISAAERYKNIITLFCDVCMQRNTEYSDKLISMNIYYIPNLMENISRLLLPLIPSYVRPKIQLFTKKESGDVLNKILQ